LTNRFGEVTETYYDWGAKKLNIYSVPDPFDTSSLAFNLEKSLELAGGYSGSIIIKPKGGSSALLYQPGLNELHPTHRQTQVSKLGDTLLSFDDTETPRLLTQDVSVSMQSVDVLGRRRAANQPAKSL
jgi:hypothetical protein